jgi:hypothetical protein
MAEPAELFRILLRHGIDVENALEPTLEFLEAYPSTVSEASSPTGSFAEEDLRRANRGGARISAAEIAAVLERRREIERRLDEIDPDASLAARSVRWGALTGLFDAFAGIRGIGFSKLTKTLHPKRPALIPMLDSVVQAYLEEDDPGEAGSFGDRATQLVRGYKRDLDRNRRPLRQLRRELAARGYRLTEVRILDILIWSFFADHPS